MRKKRNNMYGDIPDFGSAAYPVKDPGSGEDIPGEECPPDGDGGYVPRHLSPDGDVPDRGDYIRQPDGTNIAPNGAVVRNPWSQQPEIKPDNEYTDEKEDLDLLIM